MKRIAIFVSGTGDATERIVKLFNEGNRVRTEVIILDDSSVSLMDRIKNEDVIMHHIPDSEWAERSKEIAGILKDNDIELLVLDNFDLALSDEIKETTNGEILRVSSPDQAPREIVSALESHLRKHVEELKVEEVEEGDPSPESEWAKALKIQYRPPKIPTTPPEVPGTGHQTVDLNQQKTESEGSFNSVYPGRKTFRNNSYYSNEERTYTLRTQTTREDQKPMPSTWLIWSILVTVFCCFIPGIIAIIFSSQVSSRYYAGDMEGARRSSRMAEIWIIISFVLGVLTATLYLPFLLIG